MKSGLRETVTVIGAIHLDIKGVSEGDLLAGTSNPGLIEVSPGGVGRNIAENLSRLGVGVTLLGALGDDSFGRYVEELTKQAGVDISQLQRTAKAATGVYLSLTDHEHRAFCALSDTRTAELVTPAYIRGHESLLAGSAFVILDTNLPEETLEEAARIAERHGVPVVIEPVSVKKAARLKKLKITAACLTPNALEYRSLTGGDPDIHKPGALPWVKRVYVTLGDQGVLALGHTLEENRLYASIPTEVTDENGAGDAFTAGLVAGLVWGYSEEKAVKTGIGAAVVTLRSPRTVSEELSMETLERVLNKEKPV
ncbi:MAG: carbohydrate kinase family protein [Spirochaetales bacterium]|nr:carbohydrate kinase family protein [Spirochaetales bacterium]